MVPATLSTVAVLLAATMTGHRTPIDIAAITACAAVLAILAGIDVRRRVIPNRVVYPMLGIVCAVALIRAEQSFVGALAGAAFAATPFLVAFFVLPPRMLTRVHGVRPQRSGRTGDVRWAGVIGAIAVLMAGLAQAEQATGGAIAATIIAGGPFAPLYLGERRNSPEDNPGAARPMTRGMGGGDVKLAALLGAIAGVPGVFAALSIAVFAGACAAVTLTVMRRGGAAIPYGPFLAAGAVLAMM
jgi:prepilin signal peptidase PulO-like enzyme (type II secretory pathway)